MSSHLILCFDDAAAEKDLTSCCHSTTLRCEPEALYNIEIQCIITFFGKRTFLPSLSHLASRWASSRWNRIHFRHLNRLLMLPPRRCRNHHLNVSSVFLSHCVVITSIGWCIPVFQLTQWCAWLVIFEMRSQHYVASILQTHGTLRTLSNLRLNKAHSLYIMVNFQRLIFYIIWDWVGKVLASMIIIRYVSTWRKKMR